MNYFDHSATIGVINTTDQMARYYVARYPNVVGNLITYIDSTKSFSQSGIPYIDFMRLTMCVPDHPEFCNDTTAQKVSLNNPPHIL